jgi:AraC-like DNA-binding protein/mannose-6-phosphate isomerase-like protein (cupin superfamily)
MHIQIGFETIHSDDLIFPFAIRKMSMSNRLNIPGAVNVKSKQVPVFYYSDNAFLPEDRTVTNNNRFDDNESSIRLPDEWNNKTLSRVDVHLHDFCQLTMVKQGKLLYCFKDKQYELKEGDVILINAYIPHTWFAITETIVYSAGYYPYMLSLSSYGNELEKYFRILYGNQYPAIPILYNGKSEDLSVLFETLYNEFNEKKPGCDLVINNLLVNLSTSLIRRFIPIQGISKSDDKTLRTALDYIDSHLSEKITLEDVAGAVNMSVGYFSSYFKKKLGVGGTEYINKRRLSKAVMLIKTTDKPVTEIAFECGFNSLSVFYDNFTKTYSTPPLKFRKRYGESS